MVGIILVTHGPYAEAIIKSVEMVYGKQKKIQAICLEQGESAEKLENEIDVAIKELNTKEILIIVDLLGGTPCNISSVKLNNPCVNVITGLNMPMLLEVLHYRDDSIEKLSCMAIEGGKNGIVNVKQKFENMNN